MLYLTGRSIHIERFALTSLARDVARNPVKIRLSLGMNKLEVEALRPQEV